MIKHHQSNTYAVSKLYNRNLIFYGARLHYVGEIRGVYTLKKHQCFPTAPEKFQNATITVVVSEKLRFQNVFRPH